MRRTATRIILAALLLVSSVSPAFARAWLQKPGGYFFKGSGSYLYTTTEFDHNGDEVPLRSGSEFSDINSFRDVAFEGYLEYGVSDRLTFIGKLPFKILTQTRTETNEAIEIITDIEAINGGLSDLTLGLRAPLKAEGFPVTVEGNIKVPLGYEQNPANQGPALGSAAIDLDGTLLVGFSLFPFPGYFEAGVGYRLRGGGLDDQVLFGAETGVNWRRIFAKVTVDGLVATQPPEPIDGSSTDVEVNKNIFKLLPGVAFKFSETFWVSADAYTVLAGKNTATGTTYSLGLVFLR